MSKFHTLIHTHTGRGERRERQTTDWGTDTHTHSVPILKLTCCGFYVKYFVRLRLCVRVAWFSDNGTANIYQSASPSPLPHPPSASHTCHIPFLVKLKIRQREKFSTIAVHFSAIAKPSQPSHFFPPLSTPLPTLHRLSPIANFCKRFRLSESQAYENDICMNVCMLKLFIFQVCWNIHISDII